MHLRHFLDGIVVSRDNAAVVEFLFFFLLADHATKKGFLRTANHVGCVLVVVVLGFVH